LMLRVTVVVAIAIAIAIVGGWFRAAGVVGVLSLVFSSLCTSTATLSQNRYLELADWVLTDAVRSAREDNEWEHDIDSNLLKAGEIRFTMNKMGLVHAAGAGIQPTVGGKKNQRAEVDEEKTPVVEKPKIIAYEGIPAIASKTVKAQDVYKAAQQHDNLGLELQPLVVNKQTILETTQSR
jgi:hypothetical protein